MLTRCLTYLWCSARAQTFDSNLSRPGFDSIGPLPPFDGVQTSRWCSRKRKTQKATGLRTFINEPPIQRLILPSGATIVPTHHPPPLWSWFPHFLCSVLRWVAAGTAADKWSKKGGKAGCVREIDGEEVVSLTSVLTPWFMHTQQCFFSSRCHCRHTKQMSNLLAWM